MQDIKNGEAAVDTKATGSSRTSVKDEEITTPENSATEIFIDPQLEKQTLRKFDKYLMPQLATILILCYLDRSNIGNAKVFGFEEGIGMVGTQFNTMSTLFYITYIIFETPCVMLIKRFGPKKMLGIVMVSWSITTLCTGFIQTYTQAIIVRLLLGFFEAGLLPGIVFIMSTIWARESQGKRVALCYGCNAASGAFGGLIAYGIQSGGTRLGLAPWRWLFIIEGAISVVLCSICYFTLPSDPETAWFLTEEEKGCMRMRKERDIMFKGESKFEWKYARMAFTDPFIYLASLTFFCSSIPIFGFSTFLPTIIKGLGYTSIQANYLTIPVYVLACISLITGTTISDRLRLRHPVLMAAAVPVIIGYILVSSTASVGAGYFAMFLCASGMYLYNCLMLTWVSNNLSPDYKRSVGIPLFASLGNISGVVASNIYPSNGGPRYVSGNAVSAVMETCALCGIVAIWALLRWRNKQKDKLMAEGSLGNGYEDDRALGFRYNL